MVKKLFAQLALGMIIGLTIMPVVLAMESEATSLSNLGNPWNADNANPTGDIKPCVQESVQDPKKPNDTTKRVPGPDDGYVITIMEEPLNIKEVGKTKTETAVNSGVYEKGDDYVVRRCFRNTFQYTEEIKKGAPLKIVDYKHHTLPMLAKTCSKTAQSLMKTFNETETLKHYSVKYSCKEVQVILTKGGASAIYGYINMIYRWGASLVGIIAVTIIVGSGIQISASGGDQEAIGSAKKRIIQSIVGIIVLFLSSLILYTINPTFFTM